MLLKLEEFVGTRFANIRNELRFYMKLEIFFLVGLTLTIILYV